MDVQGRQLHADDHLHRQLAVAVLATALAMLPGVARAQVSVEVAPPRVDLSTANGGTPQTQAITLTNKDKNPVRIRARVDDWFLSKDGTPQFVLAEGKIPFSAAAWTRVNPSEQVAQPGETVTVRFTTTAPAGTTAGGYRAAIMFEFEPPGGDAGGRGRSVTFKGRVATVVYVTVGAPKPAVELVDVQEVDPSSVGPPVVMATLKNTGRVHVRTRGQMLIYNQAGSVVRRIPIPDVPVLPESERALVMQMVDPGQEPLPPGQYRVEFRIDVGLPEVLVGETTVTIGK